MYSDHFGFSGRPFQLTPDPRFWFESATHKKAMAYLGYGLAQGEGFIVVTGEIGAGKTTLVEHLFATIDPARIKAARIVSTQVGGDDMLRLIARGFDVPTDGADKAHLLAAIETALIARARSGQKALLIVDECQNLPIAALEELRMLSNFQAGGHAMLQVFMLGQPEFRDMLAAPELEQLRQRVIATHHLTPMNADEVRGYVEHRLRVVGWAGSPSFADDSFTALHRHSGGIPRLINQLAERALLMAAVEGCTAIDGAIVEAVVADRRQEVPVAAPSRPVLVAGDGAALDTGARLAMIETRVNEQDAALRHVLNLLIDWVEAPERTGFAHAPAA